MRPIPAQVVTDVLQDHGEQEDLEGQCGQVVVEEERLVHQEEGQVVHGPATDTQGPGQHPAQPAVWGRSCLQPAPLTWAPPVKALPASGPG